VDLASLPITAVTWNLQGSAGVDVTGVAGVVASIGADVVVAQEIQRGQARRLARALEMPSMRWAFKNLAPSSWPEGQAVFTPHRLTSTDSFVLQRAWLWNWRRRIGLLAEIERANDSFGIINVHLSPHDAGDRRRREAHLVVERARRAAHLPLIAGDLNDLPGGPGYSVVTGSGWSDAWAIDTLKDVDGPTNWTAGDRFGRAPTQRLDYVFAPVGWTVDSATVLADAERFDWFAERSDHLPLLATLRPPESGGAP
jgi:endonuclease/exonuclease/phosphatase family metal-dependent hydrolase